MSSNTNQVECISNKDCQWIGLLQELCLLDNDEVESYGYGDVSN